MKIVMTPIEVDITSGVFGDDLYHWDLIFRNFLDQFIHLTTLSHYESLHQLMWRDGA
jgi:hypothetical protein